MGITIEVENTFGDVIKRKRVQDLNRNFFNTANKLISKECGLGLRNYYEYNIVFVENTPYPFIIRGTECEWHVPIDDVTINDFMLTHGINDGGVIVVNEVRLGVGDPHYYIYEFVSWVPVLWPIISNAVTLAGLIKKVLSIYHKLIGKDKKAVKPYEFLVLLKTREEWSMPEIKTITHYDDETVIETLLMIGGYRKEEGKYIRNCIESKRKGFPLQEYHEYINRNAKECWGEYDINTRREIRDIAEIANRLNSALTCLLLQSKLSNADYFEVMMHIVDSCVEEWSSFIRKGQMVQFVTVNKEFDSFLTDEGNIEQISNDLAMLEHDMEMLIKYTYSLGEKLDILLKRTDSDFPDSVLN